MTEKEKKLRVVISGAGIVGLLTAQALKAREIEFEIIDRDRDAHFREDAGWAITLHWALNSFKQLLPEDLINEVYAAQVRPNFHKSDTGTFKYINATTGETVVSIPPASRLRVRREQIRRILLTDIDVNWNCKLETIEKNENLVKVTCTNGRLFQGDLLLGCEGSNSMTRRIICPEDGELNYLPIRFCGAKIRLSKNELDDISKNFDPLLFQGTVPCNESFFWFSILSTPEYTKKEGIYYAQVNLSWKYSKGEPFESAKDKASAMLKHSEGLHKNLSWMVHRAVECPDGLMEIKLCDWPEVEWDTLDNSVLLLGDSAHAMTMYRGEAANHGITDVLTLILHIDSYLRGEKHWNSVVSEYCTEVKKRAAPAVLLSRQAALDAHDFSKIRKDSQSPLLAIRKIK